MTVERQTAVYQALTGDAQLMAMVRHVFDARPPGGFLDSHFPCVELGEEFSVRWGTKAYRGHDDRFTIHVWSRKRGRGEVKRIHGHIERLLDRARLQIAGRRLIDCTLERDEIREDPDGKTMHGVQDFRVLYK